MYNIIYHNPRKNASKKALRSGGAAVAAGDCFLTEKESFFPAPLCITEEIGEGGRFVLTFVERWITMKRNQKNCRYNFG